MRLERRIGAMPFQSSPAPKDGRYGRV
ncbi:hypothetical protein NSND_60385 [Nitrospira sp. ND1]|nr:hypothetical protein NSND_60385 [Nitrospira sp. ND1]